MVLTAFEQVLNMIESSFLNKSLDVTDLIRIMLLNTFRAETNVLTDISCLLSTFGDFSHKGNYANF